MFCLTRLLLSEPGSQGRSSIENRLEYFFGHVAFEFDSPFDFFLGAESGKRGRWVRARERGRESVREEEKGEGGVIKSGSSFFITVLFVR